MKDIYIHSANAAHTKVLRNRHSEEKYTNVNFFDDVEQNQNYEGFVSKKYKFKMDDK